MAVIDGVTFDSLFHGLVQVNTEGEMVTRLAEGKDGCGVPFSAATDEHFLSGARSVSPTAMGCLSLAWQHRSHLLPCRLGGANR